MMRGYGWVIAAMTLCAGAAACGSSSPAAPSSAALEIRSLAVSATSLTSSADVSYEVTLTLHNDGTRPATVTRIDFSLGRQGAPPLTFAVLPNASAGTVNGGQTLVIGPYDSAGGVRANTVAATVTFTDGNGERQVSRTVDIP